MGEVKKTALFIVEGSSDKSALEKIFKTIYRHNKNIEFRFTTGDISSDPTVTIGNVEDRIYKIIQDFMRDKKLSKSDIFHVVQLFDMDGAYIPDSAIVHAPTYKFTYSLTNISCSYPDRAIERNTLKRNIMDYLLTKHDIEGIPYEMYFVSCNLDHALYNEQNLDDDLKQQYADQFYEKFLGKEHLFPDFLRSEVVNGVPDTPVSSWNYIKADCHSLERHTNLHIYFLNNPTPGGLI